ncbi:MAG: nicotinate (nicotinamide) nucleotide adenylyltransferase [Marinifilaceae bacterium]|jgi:nicotinate-nucleotide adenylyltransferase|nr:nicotinate (nicotinamide) nucleotide adenylyltransferase [Marinifilaceae bacterium]
MKVGLFFGSFNPIHIGHLAIANYMVEYSDLNQIWFVVSPQNPFKHKSSLLDEYQRLDLVNKAIGDDSRFRACDIEFRMPKPSYTSDTLAYLNDKYSHEFSLIMGADNIENFHKWKNYKIIEENHKILVYPRKNYDNFKLSKFNNVKLVESPIIEISSSLIRNAIADNKDLSYFMHPEVAKYIDQMNLYKK